MPAAMAAETLLCTHELAALLRHGVAGAGGIRHDA